MGVIASLDERVVTVEAGESITCPVRLHNNGRTVDTFTLDVLGDVAEWTVVEPETVNVFPGDDAVVMVTFAPPRSAEIPCGKKAFALRIMAQEDTEGSVIEEGTVEVGGFSEVAAELVPRTVRGARTARTKLAVDNLGNGPVTVQFTGKDESGAVDFRFKPVQTVVAGGTTQLIPLRMRMKRRFLTGQPKTFPIEIGLTASDGTKIETAGMVVQPALLPRWLPKALTFCVAGVVLLAVLGPSVLDAEPTSKAITGEELSDPPGGQSPPPPGASQSPGPGSSPSNPPEGDDAKGEGVGKKGAGQASPVSGDDGGTNGASGKGSQSSGGTKDGGSTNKGSTNGSSANDGPTGSGSSGGDPETTTENIRLQGQATSESAAFMTRKRVVLPGQTITAQEVILDNPTGSAGTLEIRRNSTVLLREDLATLTHKRHVFSGGEKFKSGDSIVVAVQCRSASVSCTPTALFRTKITTS
ncbi:hypothetical protein [Streptomyces sp. NBC_00096]|uniref:COG1470 family protein n=1 Tax=Streptomyces sp. NBC_00096 TaxID=2975650 RepID=UPI0032551607